MKIVMTQSEICNVIILIIQALILLGQLRLSKRMYKDDISKEKGYFIIEETNYEHPDRAHYRDKFKLDSKTVIGFNLAGNSDTIIEGSKTIVNGITVAENVIPQNTIFTLDKRFNRYAHEILFSDNCLKQDSIDITIIFSLKNNRGYRYSETVIIEFENEHDIYDCKFWRLSKYNMIIA